MKYVKTTSDTIFFCFCLFVSRTVVIVIIEEVGIVIVVIVAVVVVIVNMASVCSEDGYGGVMKIVSKGAVDEVHRQQRHRGGFILVDDQYGGVEVSLGLVGTDRAVGVVVDGVVLVIKDCSLRRSHWW